MTPEEHWLTSQSGSEMIDANETWLEKQEGSRKVSLLVIAHARRVWQSIIDDDWSDHSWNYGRGRCRTLIDRCAAALDVCERFLEGEASVEERAAAIAEMEEFDRTNHGPFLSLPLNAAVWCATAAFSGESVACYSLATNREGGAELSLAILLRDIFGNLFRPVSFSPDWRTGTAVSLARVMYESREFSAMPILADALQDAGCDNDDILSHCRDATQLHARGCWVVDLVLGKD
jgi:hypothetical protein